MQCEHVILHCCYLSTVHFSQDSTARPVSGLKRGSRPPPLSISLAQEAAEVSVAGAPASSVRVGSPEDDEDEDTIQPTQKLMLPK